MALLGDEKAKAYKIKLGLRLRRLREDRNLSIKTVASMVGCSTATISRIENGEQTVTTDFLVAVSEMYDTPLSKLVNVDESITPEMANAMLQMDAEYNRLIEAVFNTIWERYKAERGDKTAAPNGNDIVSKTFYGNTPPAQNFGVSEKKTVFYYGGSKAPKKKTPRYVLLDMEDPLIIASNQGRVVKKFIEYYLCMKNERSLK